MVAGLPYSYAAEFVEATIVRLSCPTFFFTRLRWGCALRDGSRDGEEDRAGQRVAPRRIKAETYDGIESRAGWWASPASAGYRIQVS